MLLPFINYKKDEILVHHSLSILASHDPKDLPNCKVQRETLAKNAIRRDSDKEINYVGRWTGFDVQYLV